MSEQLMPQGGGRSNTKSCCLYGCIGLVVVTLLAVLVAGGVAYYAYKWVTDAVENLTGTEPVELPVTELSPDSQETLDAKLADLESALDGQSETKEFVLTADELNGMLDGRKDLPYGDWVHLAIQDGVITGQVSMPLDETPFAFLGKGRYFNGTGTFEVSILNGRLGVFLVDVDVKDAEIPANFVQQIRSKNLAEEVHDPELLALFSKVDELKVEDDHIPVSYTHLRAHET